MFSILVFPCTDSNSDCPGWASDGECEANPNYMLSNCQLSCNTCYTTTEAPTTVVPDTTSTGTTTGSTG
jgi:hypothetical protein